MRKALILLAILSLVFVSCGRKAEVKKVDAAGNLYVDGVDLMKKKKYDKAITNFNKIRENYPFDPLALVAAVKLGDAHFARKEYQMAATVYEDFANSYPEDENTPYVLKQIGECYEKLSPTIDRDQANTYKAVERFTFLKNRYPASTYAKDIDAHIKTLTEKLAAREFYVGEFYHRAYRYNAAIMRLEYFLEKFPNGKDREKALWYLSQDYKEMNRPEKSAQYAEKLKQEFPRSVFITGTVRERKTLRMAKASVQQPATPTARDFSYEERKKREIDLRPVETPADKEAKTVKEGAEQAQAPTPPPVQLAQSLSGQAAKEGAATAQGPATGRTQEKTPQAATVSPAASASAAKSGTGAVQAAPEKADQKTAAADADAKGKTEQPKKAGDKKDSLGFFTAKKPVDVVADTMEGTEKGKVILFKGNVVAKQEDLYLFSDTLTAYMNEESNEIDRAKAQGNVKIVKLDRTATCNEADFYNNKGEIILRGNVVVFSGNDKVSGETVTYYINEDRVHVQGEKDKRAKAVITPK